MKVRENVANMILIRERTRAALRNQAGEMAK